MSASEKPERSRATVTAQEALDFHSMGRPGKLEIVPTKPMATQRDLSLAYSPGVAVPVQAIAENPAAVFDYTARGNLVAVISNGTAILGLGNLGPLASKPVMEGKSVLFKRFADVDSIDLEVDTENVDEFINCVRYLGPSFGGINLEDIKAPECFIIESRLRELMDIPVFHDDQHGTAIIAAAGLINALELTGRDLKTTKLVCNGAGAAAIACIELIKAMGFAPENVTLCDTKGVIFQGRSEGMNQWKSAHAVKTGARTLADAMKGADVVLGLSQKGAFCADMIRSMAANPIIFAMANPDPEITPEEVAEIRGDAIMATGRSDYPNQINNVLCFPYIFRGALDVQATTINEPMKIAAVRAIASLARQEVPDEVAAAYHGQRPHFGAQYIIPVPFDPRLIAAIPAAVAAAAMDSGVARKPIADFAAYKRSLLARRDPIASTLDSLYAQVRANPKRVVFAEAEEAQVLRAAIGYADQGLGTAVLLGREAEIEATARKIGVELDRAGIEIANHRLPDTIERYSAYLYERLQRKGFLLRDCQRLIRTDRNHFAACMVALGDADAIVTGATRKFPTALKDIRRCIDTASDRPVIGVSMAISRGRTVFVADTAVHDSPGAAELADIAETAAAFAREMGYTPRVAFLSSATFGSPVSDTSDRMRAAVAELDGRDVDFEYDGEMGADVALNAQRLAQYPFCRLSDTANVLIMPGTHSASISSRMLQELGGSTVIGPILLGFARSVQITSQGARDRDIVNLAAIAAYNAGD
ncbi:NADP-dependent malic enzyme [Rhizobiaceae bacterium BDR2-2]|uniref:NADP-dependent malic enzyme n=1 Tax=Ectorhizobium quercum TaxID=2965071 RepID=A0AAE3MX90_9HYPH|nr:NADP-dependent malic enzyme [Ectorhizobium quercum]MCX8995774.1 NADP-dependent malic enzyme [Ectorhizobium quercum]